MRKKLLLAVVCILALPILLSTFQSESLNNSAPFATVAFAGHTGPGTWCQCGCPGCICDPGEEATLCLGNIVSSDNGPKKAKNRTAPAAEMPGANDFDLGSGALLVALMVLMLRRMWF